MRPLALAGPILGMVLAYAAPPALAEPANAQALNPHINCTCRANGRSYALGERVCLVTPSGKRVAECRMQQNVTSWAIGSDDCVVSAAAVAMPFRN